MSSRLLPFFAAVTAFLAVVQHDPFFWDTVQLASKHAHFFYENDLRWAPLPAAVDSGHPPVFGWLLAFFWTVFGKNLPVSHWMMLPFLLGNVWLLGRLGRRLGSDAWAVWLLPIVLLDPVVAGQSALVSPDVALIFCFLLTLEGWFGRRWWIVGLGVLGLCSISMRGMMTAGALFTWMLFRALREPGGIKPRALQFLIAFLPGFAFAAWFLWWHWQATGWVGFHPGSPWAGAFQRVGWTGFGKNVLVAGWRWVDFGRCFEWMVIGILVLPRLKAWAEKAWAAKQDLVGSGPLSFQPTTPSQPTPSGVGKNAWPGLLICLIVFLLPSALLYQNLSAHRYFLPLFVAFHLFVFQWIVRSGFSGFKKNLLFATLALGLATGNLWVYPRGISMDWDSTLAHRPYHRLRAEMLVFLEKENIDFGRVGSAFPNLNTGENLQLNGDGRQFAAKDFERNDYVLASNVFNDFSGADYFVLSRDWVLIKRLESAGVWLELYARRETSGQNFQSIPKIIRTEGNF